jgi:hypothetical protein
MKIRHYEKWWFDSILCISIKSHSTSVALCPWASVGMPLCYSVSHVITTWITSSSVSNLYSGLHPSGLQIGGSWKLLDRGCRMNGCPNFVMASQVSRRVRGPAVSYWSKVSVGFWWGQTHWNTSFLSGFWCRCWSWSSLHLAWHP